MRTCAAGHVNDIWMPLTKGAALAVIPKDILLDPPALSKTLAKLKINAAILTPKILEMYADLAPHVLSVLKLIQFAGERMRLDAALKLCRALPEGRWAGRGVPHWLWMSGKREEATAIVMRLPCHCSAA